ncbi:MAG: hypothetical protein K1X88_19295 [Nannocystaceae bacterium]|nr:hypothetical protein [Nannocystaceae bacterium]
MTRPRALLFAWVLAFACERGHGPTTRAPATAPVPNTAAALHARAQQLATITVLDLDGAVLGRCRDEVVAQVREALVAGDVLEGLAAGPPPWDVRLRLQLHEGTTFVARLASDATVRLCPGEHDPKPSQTHDRAHDGSASHLDAGDPALSDCTAAAAATRGHELAIPPALFDEVARIVGRPPRREYQLAPGATNSPFGPEVR